MDAGKNLADSSTEDHDSHAAASIASDDQRNLAGRTYELSCIIPKILKTSVPSRIIQAATRIDYGLPRPRLWGHLLAIDLLTYHAIPGHDPVALQPTLSAKLDGVLGTLGPQAQSSVLHRVVTSA